MATALDTFNRHGVTAGHVTSKEGDGYRVILLMPPCEIHGLPVHMTAERALELAAWLVVGAELAGHEDTLGVLGATVEAIRNV